MIDARNMMPAVTTTGFAAPPMQMRMPVQPQQPQQQPPREDTGSAAAPRPWPAPGQAAPPVPTWAGPSWPIAGSSVGARNLTMGTSPYGKSVDMVDVCEQLMGAGELLSRIRHGSIHVHVHVVVVFVCGTCLLTSRIDMCFPHHCIQGTCILETFLKGSGCQSNKVLELPALPSLGVYGLV